MSEDESQTYYPKDVLREKLTRLLADLEAGELLSVKVVEREEVFSRKKRVYVQVEMRLP